MIAGYSSGGVSFYHAGNGTELASVDTGSSAVLAVKRGGQARCLGGGIMVAWLGQATGAKERALI